MRNIDFETRKFQSSKELIQKVSNEEVVSKIQKILLHIDGVETVYVGTDSYKYQVIIVIDHFDMRMANEIGKAEGLVWDEFPEELFEFYVETKERFRESDWNFLLQSYI